MRSMPVTESVTQGDRHRSPLVESESSTGGQSIRNVPVLHIPSMMRLVQYCLHTLASRPEVALTSRDPIRDNQTRSVVLEDQGISGSLSTCGERRG